MKAALNWLGTLFIALCVGTFLSLAVLVGMLWWKGALSDDRWLGMLAALQGIEPVPVLATGRDETDAEQPSLDQLLEKRVAASLDLELRETAIDKSLGDLRILETNIKTENDRLDKWKLSFDMRLAKLESQTTDEALLQLQRMLEVMSPKQAKDQILRMLKDTPNTDDDPMRDVVTILKTMPGDKQKKILAEFKLEPEEQKLAEVLRQVRLGSPDADLIRETRNELQSQLQPQR
jgi:hypothetical protein